MRSLLLFLLWPVIILQGQDSTAYATLSNKDYNVCLANKGYYYQVPLPLLKACQNISVTDGVISVTCPGNYLVMISYDRQGYNDHLLKFKITADFGSVKSGTDVQRGIVELTDGQIVALTLGVRIKLWVSCSSRNCYTQLRFVNLTIVRQ